MSPVVSDDGDGLDVAEAEAREAGGSGLGQAGVRERSALAGGHVVVESGPGRGTEIRAIFPSCAGRSPGCRDPTER